MRTNLNLGAVVSLGEANSRGGRMRHSYHSKLHLRTLILCASLLQCSSLSSTAAAQSLFGTILGTVTDSSQAVVAGARITIRNVATNTTRSITTDASGSYEAPTLPVGIYDVVCEMAGFKRSVVTGVVVQVDQRQRLDIVLQLGEVVQSLEVSAAARLIETETAAQGTVIDNQRIIQLPLNGRDFQQLAVLGPGVIAPVPGSGDRVSVAGARGLGTSFLMDGTTNSNANANVAMISPSIDLIQEFNAVPAVCEHDRQPKFRNLE